MEQDHDQAPDASRSRTRRSRRNIDAGPVHGGGLRARPPSGPSLRIVRRTDMTSDPEEAVRLQGYGEMTLRTAITTLMLLAPADRADLDLPRPRRRTPRLQRNLGARLRLGHHADRQPARAAPGATTGLAQHRSRHGARSPAAGADGGLHARRRGRAQVTRPPAPTGSITSARSPSSPRHRGARPRTCRRGASATRRRAGRRSRVHHRASPPDIRDCAGRRRWRLPAS